MSRILNEILSFVPAEYMPGKDCHVRYYVKHPDTGKLERKKIRLNRIPEKVRTKYAEKLVLDLNEKLFNGWTPFAPGLDSSKSLIQVISEYLNSKQKELRENSMRSYRSYTGILATWLKKHKKDRFRPNQFDKQAALSFMNDIFLTHGARTYNNYLTGFRTFWNWMIQYNYTKENPFKEITKKKTTEKDRTVIDKETRSLIRDYLRRHDEPFLIVCYLLFYCLIRPNEITFLKLTNFNISGSTIFIPANASKNRKGDKVTIPDVIAKELENFVLKTRARQTDFLFSDQQTLMPGSERLDPRNLTRRWSRLRKTLSLPPEYQLYSLKDTGIVQLLEDGVPPNEVMLQARHEDLATTTHYLRFVNYGASLHVKKKASDFGSGQNSPNF